MSVECIAIKDRSNLCDFFSPRSLASSKDQKMDTREDLLAQAEALFKKN